MARLLWTLLIACPSPLQATSPQELAQGELEYSKTQKELKKKVDRYNAYALGGGSPLDEEAKQIEADMAALRANSENMRRELDTLGQALVSTPAVAGGSSAPEIVPAPAAAPRPGLPRAVTIFLPYAVLLLMAALFYEFELRRPRSRFAPKVILKCPGCRRKLRVKKGAKRVRIRCPDCGVESAYNPQGGKS